MLKIYEFEEESGKVLGVGDFLSYYNLSPMDIYGKSSFRKLCAEAGLCEKPGEEEDECIAGAARKIQFLDSITLIRFIRVFHAHRDFSRVHDP